MTDWLEELLELVQEEEQPEELLDWQRTALTAVRAGERRPDRDWRAEEQTARTQMAEEQTAGEQAQPWEGEDRSFSRNGWPETEELLLPGLPEQEIQSARRRLEQTMETAEQKPERTADGQALPESGKSAVMEEAGVVRTETENQAADGLYRQLVRAGRAAEAVRPPRQTTVVEQMSTGAPSLTVDELDRAVRRDSRRYDGGMELY